MRHGSAPTRARNREGGAALICGVKGFRQPRIRTHVGEVLDQPETCAACAVWRNLESALATLDTLPLPVLEALRNHVADQVQDRTGPRADFLRAFGTYLEGPINDARMCDRRETFGMYGELR
jgi:hypothetical protein